MSAPSTAAPRQRRFAGALVLVAAALVLAWIGAAVNERRALNLESHLRRASALPFSPRGRPALHPDGRVFLVSAGDQLVGLERDGALSFNKKLPGPVTPQPVLVRGDLLVLQGEGRLLGYSLGGDPRFSIEDEGSVGDLPCADERGALYLLDGRGRLAGFSPAGQALFQTTLGLREARRVIALPSGQLLVTGARDGRGELALAEPSGLVVLRRPLPAPAAGLAASPLPDELGAVAVGAEVLTLGPGGAPRRRVALPGPVRGAPLLLPGGEIYAFVARGGALELCLAGGACVPLLAEDAPERALPVGPLLGRDGRVYAPFAAPSRWLPGVTREGVLSLGADGSLWRQALPARIGLAGVTLAWSGAPLAVSEGERYLWELADGAGGPGAYHPWPMPLGNPAAGGRPWPERP